MRIRDSSILLFAVLVTLAVRAPGVHAGAVNGINLSWDDCGTSGVRTANFACNVNVGSHSMYVSFVSPVPLTEFVGIEGTIDVLFNQATIPSWWSLESGGCRANAMTAHVLFSAGPFSCVDPYGNSGLSFVAVQPNVPSPGRLRLRPVTAMPEGVPIDAVSEYYAVKLTFHHQKTVGSSACTGCGVAACLLLQQVKLVQPVGVGDYTLTQPLDNALIGWQCPAFQGTPAPQCFACPVPSKPSTWGSVKGMYR